MSEVNVPFIIFCLVVLFALILMTRYFVQSDAARAAKRKEQEEAAAVAATPPPFAKTEPTSEKEEEPPFDLEADKREVIRFEDKGAYIEISLKAPPPGYQVPNFPYKRLSYEFKERREVQANSVVGRVIALDNSPGSRFTFKKEIYALEIKSSTDGFLLPINHGWQFGYHLDSNDVGYTAIARIYHDLDTLIKDSCKYKINIARDNYINTSIIETKEFQYAFSTSIYVNNRLLIHDCSEDSVYISLEYADNKHYLWFEYSMLNIKIKSNFSLLLLLEDRKTISLNGCIRPIKVSSKTFKTRFILTTENIQTLCDYKILKIDLRNDESVSVLQLSDIYFPGIGNIYISPTDVFQNLARDYYAAFLTLDITDAESVTNTDTEKACYLYLMHDLANGYYKIGISNNPRYRERTLQSEKPTIDLVFSKKYPSRKIAASMESALHNAYKANHIRGEWYALTGTEVDMIKGI